MERLFTELKVGVKDEGLMGAIFDLVPAIQKVFVWLVSSLLMNIFSIVLFLTH